MGADFLKNIRSPIKTPAQNHEKLTPLSVLAYPLLSVRTHHKFRKILCFRAKKCERTHLKNSSSPLVRKMSELDKTPPSLTADIFYGRSLTYLSVRFF